DPARPAAGVEEPDRVEGVDLRAVVTGVFRAAELSMVAGAVVRAVVVGIDPVDADLAAALAHLATGRGPALPLEGRLERRIAVPAVGARIQDGEAVGDRQEASVLAIELVGRSDLGVDALPRLARPLGGRQAFADRALRVFLLEQILLLVVQRGAFRVEE